MITGPTLKDMIAMRHANLLVTTPYNNTVPVSWAASNDLVVSLHCANRGCSHGLNLALKSAQLCCACYSRSPACTFRKSAWAGHSPDNSVHSPSIAYIRAHS